jgi:spermidine/putrescine transport system ATP-binding protein
VPGAKAALSIRPEHIDLARSVRAGAEHVTVINRIFLGEHTEYLVRHASLGDLLVLVARQAEASAGSFAPGDAGYISWAPETGLILPQD